MVTQVQRQFWLFFFILFFAFSWGFSQISVVGDFEENMPSYWTQGSGGSNLSWATDESRSMGRSLKITKASATADSFSWISENSTDLWSPQHYKNVDINVGAWVMTQGVNTNPTSDAEKWYISYTFYNQAGDMIGSTKLPINQNVTSSAGFVADTNAVGETILPEDSWKTIIQFVAGKDAMGTVWADDFILYGRDGWAGQNWNTAVGVPTGWNYWLPPSGGNDGRLSNGFENTIITDAEAYTGLHSLKFDLPFDRAPHDAWVGTRRYLTDNVKAGDVLRISMWLKASNLVPDSAAAYPGTWSVGVTPIFHSGYLNNDPYDEIGAHDYAFAFPAVTAFGWTQYYVDVTVPADANVKSLSVRPHVYSRFTGTVYYDHLTVEKLDVPEIAAVGDFEGNLPSYWTMGSGGDNLSWATDASRSMGRSLKITKASATADSFSWISENSTDLWSPQHYKNVDIKVGAWVMTQGVNTNPTSDAEKWYISYTFYNQAGNMIGSTKMPINQNVTSSTGFVADTNAVGETILPEDSWKTIIQFVAGKDAMGTVWADDFILYGRDGWAGQNWNTAVGVPTGWNYWLPPSGGNDGRLSNGFENTMVTDAEAYTGMHSLKFDLPFDRAPHDAWVGTRRYLLNSANAMTIKTALANDISTLSDVKAGDVLRVSMWLKASNLVPDSAATYPGTWSVGVTPIFHSGYLNNDPYDEIGAHDYAFAFPPVTAFGWTQYYVDVTVPADANVKSLSVRPHVYSRFTGTVYYDHLTVEKLDVPEIAAVGDFEGNLPSYWTMGSGGDNLSWATDASRSMGRSLKITKASATADSFSWISENSTDLWSPQHYKNVDIKVGAWVMTQGVNTNPTSDAEKWYISYTFYNQAGAMIGSTKLPINQNVTSSDGFVADTNTVGETILPEDSWKTIIQFVAGKDAMGTVWADDFILYGRDGWAGQNWNTAVGVPTGWNYWLPPSGGNDGRLSNGFENTIITDAEAYTGLHSLKFDLPFDRAPHDAWVGTRRYLLNSASPAPLNAALANDISTMSDIRAGDVLRISMWLKASNLVPDSAAVYPGTWSVGVTPIFHSGYLNNDPYDEIGAHDYAFEFPAVTAFDWTQYYVDVTVPADANVKSLSVRPHVYSRFTGTVYYDHLTVENITLTALNDKDNSVLPKTLELSNNYPNPFNPSTTIEFAVPQSANVVINVYNLVGQKINTLVSGYHSAGRYKTIWNGTDVQGNKVGSGVYFYSITNGNVNLVKKMILLK